MPAPRRHHTLPQRYQAGFSMDGSGAIWVFDRLKQSIRSANPANTAVEKDFYSWEHSRSTKPGSIESFLASFIEGPFWSVLDRLDAQKGPDSNDRLRLAFFCAFLLTRVPRFRSGIATLYASVVAENPHLEQAVPYFDSLFERSPQGLLLPAASKNLTLKKMVDIGKQVGEYLLTLDTHLMSASPEEPFITTDNPFALVRVNGKSERATVTAPGFLKWMPLSARTAVGFGEPGDNFSWTNVPPAKGRRSNVALAGAASHLVIASTKTQLEELVRGLPRGAPHPNTFPTEIL